MRMGQWRRHTANRAVCVDWRGQRLFVKVSPSPQEATAEVAGHMRLRRRYPVPELVWHRQFGRHTVLAYERCGSGLPDQGLLLDLINTADLTGDGEQLDRCLNRIIGRYGVVIADTVRQLPQSQTVTKLYGERARPGGRLDAYYGDDKPLLALPDGSVLRPSDLGRTTLVVNGRPHRVDLAAVIGWLRRALGPQRRVWAGLTQGDPTDLNIGAGPVWFDYDTAGLNALAGEFACFLWYQWAQGGWLVPRANPAAFAAHPRTFACLPYNRPAVSLARDGPGAVRLDVEHLPSPARRHVLARYRAELIQPFADLLGVDDTLDWLRPFLVLRILGVHRLGSLPPADAALSLAYLAEVLAPESRLDDLFGPPCHVPGEERGPR